MSQYSGNKTDGSFNPTYTPSGETNAPINVVSNPMEIDGQMVPGYQATYANGTSKWTPHVLTDTPIFDSQNIDRSTFTGKKQADGTWKWEPTSDTNVRNLAINYRGEDGKKISTNDITQTFYNDPNTKLQLQAVQTNVIKEEYGDKLATTGDGKFSNFPGVATEGSDETQTTEDFNLTEATTTQLNNSIKATKTRKQYGNYYYPDDIQSNKQDRIIFKMRQSTGQVIDPLSSETQAIIGTRQRKTGKIEGSVTLPIPSGIKDLNSVAWSGQKMDVSQAFKASTILKASQAAATEGESVVDTLGDQLNKGIDAVKENKGVQKAISTFIAQQGSGTQNLLSRAAGAIANPNMELLFDAPNLRAFDFTFAMSPRDATEAKQIRNIINFFKQGMSVKTTSTNIFLKAPNYFEIDYVSFNDNGEMMKHPSLNIIKTCALLSCAVDYTPNNSYMTYSDDSRSMVQYTMNLQFNELDPIYESDYYEGLGMQDNTNVQEIGF